MKKQFKNLFKLVENGDIEKVKDYLVNKNADPNIKKKLKLNNKEVNISPLSIAIKNKNIEIIKLLVENGADVNITDENGNTALMVAVEGKKKTITKKSFFDRFEDDVIEYDINLIETLIKNGSNITDKSLSSLIYSLRNHYDTMHWSSNSKKNYEDVEKIIEIILKNSNLKLDPCYLTIAIISKSKKVVKLLLENGIKINFYIKLFLNNDNYTPLILSIIHNDSDIVELLLRYGADLSIKDKKGKIAIDYNNENCNRIYEEIETAPMKALENEDYYQYHSFKLSIEYMENCEKIRQLLKKYQTFFKSKKDVITYLNFQGVEKLYHFTNIWNLELIYQLGGLRSKNYLIQNGYKDKIKFGGNSLSRNLDYKFNNMSYISLSFNQKIPMFENYKTIDHLVFLEIDLEAIDETTLFTDRNATDNSHKRGNWQSGIFQYLDFKKILAPYDYKYNHKEIQAEILIKDFIPLKYIKSIVCISPASMKLAKAIAPELEDSLFKVDFNYFGDNISNYSNSIYWNKRYNYDITILYDVYFNSKEEFRYKKEPFVLNLFFTGKDEVNIDIVFFDNEVKNKIHSIKKVYKVDEYNLWQVDIKVDNEKLLENDDFSILVYVNNKLYFFQEVGVSNGS